MAIAAGAVAAFELWRRSIAGAGPRGAARAVPARRPPPRSSSILVAAPCRAYDRAVRAYQTASAIRLPDPQRISAAAVVAVRRAVDRVERFDLARDLPAPLDEVDLSDLAYRLWSEGEEEAASATLIAYEVFDDDGALRSRFSLIPETDLAGTAEEGSVVIDRYRVAVVRRRAALNDGAARWGYVMVAVADWPVVGSAAAAARGLPPARRRRRIAGIQAPRPVLALYGPDGSRRDEGPELTRGAHRTRAPRGLSRGAAHPVPRRGAARRAPPASRTASSSSRFRVPGSSSGCSPRRRCSLRPRPSTSSARSSGSGAT